jgi:hypothetical protein
MVALGCLLIAVACGDDESSPGGGSSGTSGASGKGGSAGTGGSKSSSGGASSKGGSAGTSSKGGSAGTPNAGGAAGSDIGSAGEAGFGATGGEGGSPPSGPNIVFATSSTWAPQALGGLAGADEKCQTLADGAGLDGTFVAWLSDSTTDARDRLGTARGWVRTDGKPFADTVADIAAGLHYYTPSFDQTGNRITSGVAPVITGTGVDGTKSAPFGDYCQDYGGANASYGVVRGELNYTDDRWTQVGELVGDLQACASVARLYCFQIDHNEPVVASFPATRKAFVSANAVRPDMGRAAFDTQCATEAGANSLVGTFLAFVSTNTQAAASRFNLTGLTYGRVDGLPIVAQASDLATATMLEVPINLFANGTLISGPNQIVYSGADTPSETSTNGTSCNNWSISVFDNFVQVGNPGVSGPEWWNNRTDWRCNTWVKLYCLEQ